MAEWPKRWECVRCAVGMPAGAVIGAVLQFTYPRRIVRYSLCRSCSSWAEDEIVHGWEADD